MCPPYECIYFNLFWTWAWVSILFYFYFYFYFFISVCVCVCVWYLLTRVHTLLHLSVHVFCRLRLPVVRTCEKRRLNSSLVCLYLSFYKLPLPFSFSIFDSRKSSVSVNITSIGQQCTTYTIIITNDCFATDVTGIFNCQFPNLLLSILSWLYRFLSTLHFELKNWSMRWRGWVLLARCMCW